jgi:hypothetical protein
MQIIPKTEQEHDQRLPRTAQSNNSALKSTRNYLTNKLPHKSSNKSPRKFKNSTINEFGNTKWHNKNDNITFY